MFGPTQRLVFITYISTIIFKKSYTNPSIEIQYGGFKPLFPRMTMTPIVMTNSNSTFNHTSGYHGRNSPAIWPINDISKLPISSPPVEHSHISHRYGAPVEYLPQNYLKLSYGAPSNRMPSYYPNVKHVTLPLGHLPHQQLSYIASAPVINGPNLPPQRHRIIQVNPGSPKPIYLALPMPVKLSHPPGAQPLVDLSQNKPIYPAPNSVNGNYDASKLSGYGTPTRITYDASEDQAHTVGKPNVPKPSQGVLPSTLNSVYAAVDHHLLPKTKGPAVAPLNTYNGSPDPVNIHQNNSFLTYLRPQQSSQVTSLLSKMFPVPVARQESFSTGHDRATYRGQNYSPLYKNTIYPVRDAPPKESQISGSAQAPQKNAQNAGYGGPNAANYLGVSHLMSYLSRTLGGTSQQRNIYMTVIYSPTKLGHTAAQNQSYPVKTPYSLSEIPRQKAYQTQNSHAMPYYAPLAPQQNFHVPQWPQYPQQQQNGYWAPSGYSGLHTAPNFPQNVAPEGPPYWVQTLKYASQGFNHDMETPDCGHQGHSYLEPSGRIPEMNGKDTVESLVDPNSGLKVIKIVGATDIAERKNVEVFPEGPSRTPALTYPVPNERPYAPGPYYMAPYIVTNIRVQSPESSGQGVPQTPKYVSDQSTHISHVQQDSAEGGISSEETPEEVPSEQPIIPKFRSAMAPVVSTEKWIQATSESPQKAREVPVYKVPIGNIPSDVPKSVSNLTEVDGISTEPTVLSTVLTPAPKFFQRLRPKAKFTRPKRLNPTTVDLKTKNAIPEEEEPFYAQYKPSRIIGHANDVDNKHNRSVSIENSLKQNNA